MRRSQFVEEALAAGAPRGAAERLARRAEAAGARWEPEEPAAQTKLPADVEAVIRREMQYLSGWADTLCAALAPLWPAQQPAGPARQRRLAVPLRVFPGRNRVGATVRDDDGKKVLDASAYDLWREDDEAGLLELVRVYNAPPAPAGWPAPTLAVPGDEASQPPVGELVLYWEDTGWFGARRFSFDKPWSRWWMPSPPLPPELP